MFSQTVEYALRAVALLALRSPSPLTAHQIAEQTKAPPDYLFKVLQQLGRADFVQAQRGKNGGYTLTRPPEQISILDIVQAVDPLQRIKRCPLGLESHVKLCPLHRKLDDAVRLIEESFAQVSLADLVSDQDAPTPLCESPVRITYENTNETRTRVVTGS